VRAVIFDMDGTLFDSTAVVTAAYIETVVACGGARYEPDDVVAAYGFGPPATILAHLLGRPCRDGELECYHERLRALAAGVAVYPGLFEALVELSERVPMAVSTGASASAAAILLDATGLAPSFASVAGGDEVTCPKPSPEGIRLACARLGIRPQATAYVGDSALDLAAACRAGAVAAAAGWGHLYRDQHLADRVLREPRELVALLESGSDGDGGRS
jgi:HAD superfamily hydrolase (TIGR01549 family)